MGEHDITPHVVKEQREADDRRALGVLIRNFTDADLEGHDFIELENVKGFVIAIASMLGIDTNKDVRRLVLEIEEVILQPREWEDEQKDVLMQVITQLNRIPGQHLLAESVFKIVNEA